METKPKEKQKQNHFQKRYNN